VFLTDVLVPLRKNRPSDPGVAEVYRACIQQRKMEYGRANAALASRRFRAFLLNAAEWIHAGKWQAMARSPLKRKQLAKVLVSERLSKLRSRMKTGRRIGKLDLRGLHRLRLHAKRMRYTIEFARSLYDKKSNRKRIERVLKDLGKLQSALGNLNDIASRKIVDRIVAERKHSRKDKPGTTSRLAVMISGDQEKQKSKQLDKAAKAFDKLENIKPFWT